MHEHSHPHEDYAARRHPEFVVLDLGGDVGALIVHTDPGMHGLEVEISPDGRDAERQHKAVLERDLAGDPAYTLVYDGLPAGRYTLWLDGQPRARGVEVPPAAVAELDWRTAAVQAD